MERKRPIHKSSTQRTPYGTTSLVWGWYGSESADLVERRPGGRATFDDPRLKLRGFSSVEIGWDQDGQRFRIRELVLQGASITARRCKELPLNELLHDAATELMRTSSEVELGGQWMSGMDAASLVTKASNAASRHRHPSEHLEAILRAYEAGGETQEVLAARLGVSLRQLGRWLHNARAARAPDTAT